MQKAVEALRRELTTLRTGRANPALVENLNVDYYGVPTPLKQLAAISVPEARLLLIQPWDRQVLPAIERAILKSALGLNPGNDGTVIRLPIPPMTEERRRDLVRIVKKYVEDGRVAVRNVRRDVLEKLRALERGKELAQDDHRRADGQLQKLTDAFIGQMGRLGDAKEAEILEV
ncbi:MAG: ribosome recycling factor [Chloroflexi bacterium]|nr:ribosome recycling factor [Chloroflexota bacterium]